MIDIYDIITFFPFYLLLFLPWLLCFNLS